MEWSRVPGNQKKREKKEEEESTSPAFSRSLRFILENSPPLFKKKRKVQNRMHAKYASRQRIGGTYSTIRRNWRKRVFHIRPDSSFLFITRCKDSLLEGGSERPEDGPTTGKFNYWQIHTVGPTSLLVCIIIIITVDCIVAVQVQDGGCSMMMIEIIISRTRRNPTCELFMG